uniref:Uncharacterized protein n=1 Tax=Oryza punctata TaxID=4537 RepID=A0A0E0LMP2_ORYPU
MLTARDGGNGRWLSNLSPNRHLISSVSGPNKSGTLDSEPATKSSIICMRLASSHDLSIDNCRSMYSKTNGNCK